LFFWRRFAIFRLAGRYIDDQLGELGGVAGAFGVLGYAATMG